MLRFLERWHQPILQKSELIVAYHDNGPELLNGFARSTFLDLEFDAMRLSCQTNRGVEKAKSENLVILDGDRILPSGYFEKCLEALKPGVLISAQKLRKLNKLVDDDAIVSGQYEYSEETRMVENKIFQRGPFSGQAVLTKKDYWAVGGLDEAYVGYGFEDHDVTEKLIRNGVQIELLPVTELHLYHEPLTYGSSSGKKFFIDNGLRYCNKWQVPIPPELQKEIEECQC